MNDKWATTIAQKKLQHVKSNPKEYKQLKEMYDKAVSGKVKILNAQQIASKAIQTKANSTDIDVWTKMDKILHKTRTIPFMYRTKEAWDKPSIQDNKKKGTKINDHYYISLARAGKFAKRYRHKQAKMHGKFREHPKYFKKIQTQFNNQLQKIDYEQMYREMKSWYHINNQKIYHKKMNKKELKTLVAKKYKTRNPDAYIKRDRKFIKSMNKHAREQRFSTSAKSAITAIGASHENTSINFHKPNVKKISKNIKNSLSQDLHSTNYKAIGHNIKHGMLNLFNKFTGIAKKSGKIVADRLTKLGQRLNQNPKFNYASQYATHIYDKGINRASKLLDDIGMPKLGTNARKPKHMQKHNFSTLKYTFSTNKHHIKHKMHTQMHRTQHLDMGPSL